MKFLNPTTEIALKKIFNDDKKKHILIHFLNSITKQKKDTAITDITFFDPAVSARGLGTRFTIDYIKCIDTNNTTYIIDTHIITSPDYLERCQYYTSVEVARQLQKTDTYKKLSPLVFIGISHVPVFETEAPYFLHETNTKLKLIEYYFLGLSSFNKTAETCNNSLDQWAYLLKNAGSLEEIPTEFNKNKAILDAFDALQSTNFTKKELESHHDLINAYISEMDRMAGAREDGKYEAATRIAQKLLEQGMDIPQVSAITGLEVNTVAQFRPAQLANE